MDSASPGAVGLGRGADGFRMTEMNDTTKPPTEPAEDRTQTITFKRFLETVHPSVEKQVSGLWHKQRTSGGTKYVEMLTPDLRLHCPNCNGERTFRCDQDYTLTPDEPNGEFVTYLCSDCRK